ncbi:hypothetical protein BN1723_006278 [Verticillium longisporum]|uniref:Squalene monooxygenase n=1 Tax=Verticillium longisporum TaxID=100787 RepID=A0A0G4NE24_VERLO|nr:hypothetical protein BN1723_006278 [Verticillium longisporum]
MTDALNVVEAGGDLLTIIADGYASKFRKDLIPQQPVVKSKFYALELVDAPLPSPRFGHVFIGGAYPVLMYQIGSHETRALIDVPANIPEAAPAAGGVRGYISNCGHQIDNFVFHRAAQVCLALRNYREVVTICVFAAQCNGSRDLAYSVWNFSDLCQAFTKQHEYARLRWLMSDVLGRDYRMTKQCRTSLKWVVHYLKRASQADKAEDLKASDRSMLACVEETLKKVSKEKAQWKASERASVAQIVARQNEKQARTPRTEAGGLDYYAPLRRGLDGKPPRWSGRVEEEQEDGSTALMTASQTTSPWTCLAT